ncbi:MAG: DUF433 domain-containing protein [Desulfococcaceae bacterium]|jgi:uncharacterized protein (DUF433 family)|nr:DUF433 domain-containing protein [Desulfococcaceae bacterium]
MNGFIVKTEGILGGRPRISNTRISVSAIACRYRQGFSPEEIADQYDRLELAQVYSALAWYHANRQEVDADIFREESEYERLAAEHSLLDKCA